MSGKGSRRHEGLRKNPHEVLEDEPPPVSPISALTEREDKRWAGEVSPLSRRSVDRDDGSGASSGGVTSQVPTRIPLAEDVGRGGGAPAASSQADMAAPLRTDEHEAEQNPELSDHGSEHIQVMSTDTARYMTVSRGRPRMVNMQRKPASSPQARSAKGKTTQIDLHPSIRPGERHVDTHVGSQPHGIPRALARSNLKRRDPTSIDQQSVPEKYEDPKEIARARGSRELTLKARKAASQARSDKPFALGIDMPGLGARDIYGHPVPPSNEGSQNVSHSTVQASLQQTRAKGKDKVAGGSSVDRNPDPAHRYPPGASTLDKNSRKGPVSSSRGGSSEQGVPRPKISGNRVGAANKNKPLPRPENAARRAVRRERLEGVSLEELEKGVSEFGPGYDTARGPPGPTNLSHRGKRAKRTERPSAEDPFDDRIANLHGDGTEGQSDGPPSFDKACCDKWRRTVEGVREWTVVRGIKNHFLPWIKQVIPWVLLLATWAIMVLEAASGPFFSKFSQYLTVVEYCEVKGYELGAMGYCKANTTQCVVKPLYKIDEISLYKSLDGWDGTPLLSGLLGATGLVALISVAFVLIHAARNCSNSFCCGGVDANAAEARQGRRNLLQNRVKRVYKWTLAWWLAISVGLAAWYELYDASALLMAQLNLLILVLLPLCLIIGYKPRRRPWRRQASSGDSATWRAKGKDPENGEISSPDDTDTGEAEEEMEAEYAKLNEGLEREAARATSTPSNPLSTFARSQNEEGDGGKTAKTGKKIHPDGRHAQHDNMDPPHAIANAR